MAVFQIKRVGSELNVFVSGVNFGREVNAAQFIKHEAGHDASSSVRIKQESKTFA